MADWFRSTAWDDEIAADFFAKLGRTRGQRGQYLVLQALQLADLHPDVSLRLIAQYFETRRDGFDDQRALLAKARAELALGEHAAMVASYKSMLTGKGTAGDLTASSPIEFSFLIARHRMQAEYQFALDGLLDLNPPGPEMPTLRFKFHAAQALIFAETGRSAAVARVQAEAALCAEESLPADGIESASFSDTVWRLRKIVRR